MRRREIWTLFQDILRTSHVIHCNRVGTTTYYIWICFSFFIYGAFMAHFARPILGHDHRNEVGAGDWNVCPERNPIWHMTGFAAKHMGQPWVYKWVMQGQYQHIPWLDRAQSWEQVHAYGIANLVATSVGQLVNSPHQLSFCVFIHSRNNILDSSRSCVVWHVWIHQGHMHHWHPLTTHQLIKFYEQRPCMKPVRGATLRYVMINDQW